MAPIPADEMPQVKAMAPQQRLAWLIKSLTDLGLPTDFLRGAQELVEREHALQRRSLSGPSPRRRTCSSVSGWPAFEDQPALV